MKAYLKGIAAVVGAAVTALAGLGLTGTWQQVFTVAAAVVTAAGVYVVPNTPAVPENAKPLIAEAQAKQAEQPTGGNMAG